MREVFIPGLGLTQEVPAIHKEIDCIDERDRQIQIGIITDRGRHETPGGLRTPGGSLEKLIVVSTLRPDLGFEYLIALTAEYEQSKDRLLTIHTNCGHAENASNPKNEDDYRPDGYPNFSSTKVSNLIQAIFQMASRGEIKIDQQVMQGAHNAKAVVTVDSRDATLVPKGSEPFLRIDDQRRREDWGEYVGFLGRVGVKVDLNEALRVADHMAYQTLRRVAPGLRHTHVNLNVHPPRVSELPIIPPVTGRRGGLR